MTGSADHVQRMRIRPRGIDAQRLVSWARPAVAMSFLFLVVVWAARPWVGGDTPWVLDGTNAFIDCLQSGDLVACRYRDELDVWGFMSPIGDWPLLQHIPDLISIGLGATTHPDRVRVLTLLSVAGVVSSVALARLVLARVGQAAWFWGFLLIVISGPVLVFARGTPGEMLATGLLVCLVAATVLQAPPPVVGLAALAACLTKETSYPFVATLGILGLVLARRRTGEPIRRHLVWGAAGMAAGIVMASLFNIVRYGSVLNTNYLQPELHTPGIVRKLDYVVALFVSPNGGVFFFWPAASVLLVAACLVPLVFRSRVGVDGRPALVLGGVFLVLTFGFASWWDPFGSGWGPRLTLPWVLPLVLLGLVVYGDRLGELARRLLAAPWRLLLVFATVLAFALPHVGHMWRPGQTAEFSATKSPPCDAPWRGGVEEWHACHFAEMWRVHPRPQLVYALQGIGTVGGGLTVVVVSVALLGCLIRLREELVLTTRSRG